MHAEVLSRGKAALTDRADEAIDVVDLLTRVHDQLVSTDWRQTSRTQLRHEQPAGTGNRLLSDGLGRAFSSKQRFYNAFLIQNANKLEKTTDGRPISFQHAVI